MKKVILLALLMPFPLFAQIVENFESGSLVNWVQTMEAHWKADTSESLSGKYSLHHIFDNPDAGIDQIGMKLKNLHPAEGITKWSFMVRYGYDPSSLNNWSVFLMSENMTVALSPDVAAKGYAIGVNYAGSDDTLRIWKIIGNTCTTVVNTGINWQTDIGISNPVEINVERSIEGKWTVSVKGRNGNPLSNSSGIDNELFTPCWFGIYYKYSSTRDRLLWLDDISIDGTFYEDKTAPVINGCEVKGRNSLDVTLNEEPEYGIMQPQNISLNVAENKSVSVLRKSNLKYTIEFYNEFINRSVNNIILDKLCDLSGNCTTDYTKGFVPVWAERGDVVISEIMADPLPEVSLPGKEYLEIMNRSSYPQNLKNWKLSTESQFCLFPGVILPPSAIMIICASTDTTVFKKFGNVTGLKQFPSLTDGGRLIYISDSTGELIHGVEYSSDWYTDDLKTQGGWSLEMKDTGFPFYDRGNWSASESKKGGTPGTVNSLRDNNPDISFYGIQNIFPEDSVTLIMVLSEPVFDLPEKYRSIRIGGKEVVSVFANDPLYRVFTLVLQEPLRRSEIYQLTISEDITDFSGNPIQKNEYRFGIAEPAAQGDILFNEILFNPFPGDQDYIELYNNSEKVIDASRLQIVSVNDASGAKTEAVPVSEERKCILPGDYYAITTDKMKVTDRYISADKDYLFEIGSLPSMPDDKGHLVLYNRELDRIDELSYNDDMHYSLLSSTEGVALEKTNPRNKSEEAGNWHSATESSGFGTPGAPNSVFSEIRQGPDKVALSSTKITPDNNGIEDFLTISFFLTGNSNVISISVYDETGNHVRNLAANLFAGAEASVIWDGTAEDGSMVKTGIYILLITLFDDTGKTERWKKICSVIRN